MMDRIGAMGILVAAAEAGSFSAAGRRLGVPLATVSRKVAELETHLNARLLVRSARGLAPTDAGRAYLTAAKAILQDLEAADRAAGGEYSAPTGELVVAAPIVFGRLHVLPVAAEFLAAYPDVNLRLELSDRDAHLVEDQVDVAIRIGELPDSSLTASRLGSVRQVVCASPAYAAAHGLPATPKDLAGHTAVAFEGLVAPDAWLFRDGDSTVRAPVRSRLVVSTAEAAIDAAVAGVGLTRVLGYQVAGAVGRGQLVLALQAFEPAAWPVHLLFNGHGRLPIKVRAFNDFVAPRLRQRLAGAAV